MKKFEYFYCVIDSVDLENFLNNRGEEGWELVSTDRALLLISLFFKREKTS